MQNKQTQIAKHLLVLGAFLQREASRITSDFGLTQQQFVVLKTIEEKGPINQKDICCSLMFEKSNVSKIVKKLKRDCLIDISSGSDDNRVSILAVTPKGRKILERGMELFNEWNSAWLKGLSNGDIKQAIMVLRNLVNLAR
ncbi:MAG: MarR family transcriptional regulator [Nitrospirae bacterium]|nr:MarR family transcriptional regulator [Nitrospirota bacterium]